MFMGLGPDYESGRRERWTMKVVLTRDLPLSGIARYRQPTPFPGRLAFRRISGPEG